MAYNYITQTILIEMTGYLAGLLAAVALSPQVYKSWKTKSTKDVSLGWTLIYISSLLFYEIYGIGINSYPLIIMTELEIFLALALIGLKLKHG